LILFWAWLAIHYSVFKGGGAFMGTTIKLMDQAKEIATSRGHKIIDWAIDKKGAYTTCAMCARSVTITTNPLPNEINIMGDAMAVDCNII